LSSDLTLTQKKIFDFLIEFKAEKGFLPTLSEIAKRFNYNNRSTVRQHLQALEKKNYIKRNTYSARGIEIVQNNPFFETKPILGEVAAGIPLTIYPDSIDTIELPKAAKMPKDSFLLKVKGDSLKDAYIFSGDVVIVNPNAQIKDGQIVVAIIDNEAAVKKIIRKEDTIELHSENPEYQPIIIEKNNPGLKIIGVVIGIYRTMQQ